MKEKVMEESKYTIQEIVKLLNSVDSLKSKAEKLSTEKTELENQLETKYSDDKYRLIKKETLENIVDALENSVSGMNNAEDVIGDAETNMSDAKYNLGDARGEADSCIDDIKLLISDDNE